jgi:Zn-dependent protease with chaperone function
MIELESTIGFLLALLAASVSISTIAGGAVLALRRPLRRLGPSAERQATVLALALPPLLALLTTVVLAGSSLVGVDHCPHHPHHLHLCLRHGAAWADRAWAVASLLAVVTYAGVRLAYRAARLARTTAAFRKLVALSEPIEADVLLAPANRPFSFAAGLLDPRIVMSSSAWDRLAPEERRAVIEHERAHVEQGDLVMRLLLDFFALFGAPLLAGRLLSIWERSTERLCDRRAADRIGDPSTVASALVRMARMSCPELGFASFSSPNVRERVEALLGGEPHGDEAKRQLTTAALAATLLSIVCLVVSADPLHHALESILGAH